MIDIIPFLTVGASTTGSDAVRVPIPIIMISTLLAAFDSQGARRRMQMLRTGALLFEADLAMHILNIVQLILLALRPKHDLAVRVCALLLVPVKAPVRNILVTAILKIWAPIRMCL